MGATTGLTSLQVSAEMSQVPGVCRAPEGCEEGMCLWLQVLVCGRLGLGNGG